MHYAYQEGEGAIAEALSLAEPFVDEEREYVALGDNVIEWNICVAAESFLKQQQETRVILKEVPNPERFGVHHMETDRFVRIDEKPLASHPPYAATGFCFYDQASGLRYCLHIALY
jgi:glucose-1-phosphate thymidylyltransferase